MLSVKALTSLAICAYLNGPSLLSDAINSDICNYMAASSCFKSCEDHSLLKGYNGGMWKNSYRSGS